MDLADVELLTSPAGRALLDALPAYAAGDALALQTRLRRADTDPRLAAAALHQSRLRTRAREKFGADAERMLFTDDGLEQATRPPLADRHAARFAAAGIAHVLDLGCGIGADAMASGRAGLRVDGVDADPVTAAVAAHNAGLVGGDAVDREPTRVRVGRAEDVPLPRAATSPGTGAWLDPARRDTGARRADGRARRTTGLAALAPSWETVLSIARAIPATGAKLAPAFPVSALPPGGEAQWTSWRGEVLECAVWWGPLVRSPGRTAAVCGPAGTHVVTEADAADPPPPVTSLDRLGTVLYDPDRAVVRAGLVGALAHQVGGAELDPGVGYVCADRDVAVPWARRYAVRDAIPWHPKNVRKWLRDNGFGRVTIKHRGTSLDPERVRRELRPAGTGAEITLVLTRVAGATVAVVVDPL